MGHRHFALAAVLIAFVGTSARADDKPPVFARAEQCLKDNADRIVAADPDLTSAANFLMTYRCASEIGSAARYQRNLALTQIYNSMARFNLSKSMKPVIGSPTSPESVDPETGEVIVHRPPPGAKQSSTTLDIYQIEPAAEDSVPAPTPVALRKLAGDLVLEARERRLAKAP